MTWAQTLILAFIQGITEFLPVSSSAHLILVPSLLGWPDQGLAFDVAVHVGTLAAILLYFWSDLKALFKECRASVLHEKRRGDKIALAGLIVLATIPVGLLGLFFKSFIEHHLRATQVIAYTTIGFGLLLGMVDYLNQKRKTRDLSVLKWQDALLIGLGQALSLIPGTSRSGITLTAALMCGFDRASAARFSFLMAIPVIVLAGFLQVVHLIKDPVMIEWRFLASGFCVAAISGYACIHYFLKLINRVALWPFVLYRLGLGVLLLAA
jgi:undecaprenyl-diphosphatase